jgi:two-component system nitrate/nitrite response regulator NarL
MIADDHPLILAGIRSELALEEDFTLIMEAKNGDEAYTFTCQYQPDILLLDINMPGKKAIQVLLEIKANLPTKVIMLSAYSNQGIVLSMLRAGADGYLLKDDAIEELAAAIRTVDQGGTWISPVLLPVLEGVSLENIIQTHSLTQRELEVVQSVVDGLANKEIAQKLEVVERTVEYHLSNIFRKTGVFNKIELILWVQEHGLPLT